MGSWSDGASPRRGQIAALLAVGVTAGFFAGLFGIGGGLIVVPSLVVVLAMDHRRAIGTSLLAILPAVVVSAVAYAYGGVVPVAGLLLGLGAVVGAQLGARALMVMSRRVAQWIFVAFAAISIVQLLIVVPNRGEAFLLDPWRAVGIVVLGLVAGVMSAILGIGGGGIVVPVLMVVFGASDLVAKGSSLVMMLPGVLSGLVANLRRHNVDVRAGLVVGGASLVTSPFGAWLAHAISARTGDILFAAFLLVVLVSMIRQVIRTPPTAVQAGAPDVPPQTPGA